MTEERWLTCTDPTPMLKSLRDSGRATDRKLRLFACACGRASHAKSPIAHPPYARPFDLCLLEAEIKADAGCSFDTDAFYWLEDPNTQAAAEHLALVAHRKSADCCALLRCIFGSPFRPACADPAWLTWNDGTVRRLAEAAYQERLLPQGTFDPGRLAVLADALEEAGCGDGELLGHLRGPGDHVRGCWAIDLLSGRE